MIKYTTNKIKTIALCALCLFIVACSSATQQPATINIASAQYLNPDIHGRPSPVVITFYLLKNNSSFNSATINALETNAEKTLGTDLIDKSTMEVRPANQFSTQLAITPDTKFIGVTAGYRKATQTNWKQIVKVPVPGKSSVNVSVLLESEALSASLITSQ